MPRFRSKPTEIDAIQYTGDNESEVMDWARAGAYDNEPLGIRIGSLSGKPILTTTHGDDLHTDDWEWIIREPMRPYRFYKCVPAVFALRYEPIP